MKYDRRACFRLIEILNKPKPGLGCHLGLFNFQPLCLCYYRADLEKERCLFIGIHMEDSGKKEYDRAGFSLAFKKEG